MFVAFISMSAMSQSKAKWDTKNGVYTNYTYGFSWDMGKEYKWKQEKRTAGDDSFVVSSEEVGFMAITMAAKRPKGKSFDIWTTIDKVKANYEGQLKNQGLKTKANKYEKTTFQGLHAILIDETREISGMEFHGSSYYVYKNNIVYYISLFVPSAMESIGGKDLQNMKTELLNGYKIK